MSRNERAWFLVRARRSRGLNASISARLSPANRSLAAHYGWKRGLRFGSLKDGKVIGFIPDPNENPPNTSAAEGVAIDAAGNIYGAEVGPRRLMRYEKKK